VLLYAGYGRFIGRMAPTRKTPGTLADEAVHGSILLSMAVSVPQWSNVQQSQVSKSHTHGQHLHPCNRAVPQNASTSRKAVPSMASFLPVAGGSFVMAWLGIDPTRLSLTTS